MIILDTHVWIWWVDDNLQKLSSRQLKRIRAESTSGRIGVSAISCFEIANKVSLGRDKLVLSLPVSDWIGAALAYPGVELLPLSPEISLSSTRIHNPNNRDPFDHIIVASAIEYRCSLITVDEEIKACRDVQII